MSRAARSEARRLLAEAFDGLAADQGTLELARRIDAALGRVGSLAEMVPWLYGRPLRPPARLAVLDVALVGRVHAVAEVAERLERRVSRFLEVTGQQPLGPRLGVTEARDPGLPFDLTEG